MTYSLEFDLGMHGKAVSAVKFSPDGRLVATASADCLIFVFDVATGTKKLELDGNHRQGLNDVIWTKGANCYQLVVCSDDRSIVVWDVEKGAIAGMLAGHKGFVFCLAVHPRNNLLLSGSYDGTARLWDMRQARSCAVFDAHSEPVTSLGFRPTAAASSSASSPSSAAFGPADTSWGDEFVTGGSDGIVRTWDMHSQQCLRSHMLNCSPLVPISRVLWTPNGAHLMVSTLDNQVRLWDAMSRSTALDVTGVGVPKSPILRTYSCSVGDAGPDPEQHQQSPTSPPQSAVYQNTNLCLPMTFATPTAPHHHGHAAVSRLVAGSETGHVVVWNVDSTRMEESFAAHQAAVLALDATSVGGAAWVATGGASEDPCVKLWKAGGSGQ
jgi:COMPASS component SWD3